VQQIEVSLLDGGGESDGDRDGAVDLAEGATP
jgi:hypothetical protein